VNDYLKEIKFGYKFSNLYKELKDDEPISIDIRKLSQIEKVKLKLNVRQSTL